MGGSYFKFRTKYLEQSRLVDEGPFMDVTPEVNPILYPKQQLSKE
jgi:hypothetical protein